MSTLHVGIDDRGDETVDRQGGRHNQDARRVLPYGSHPLHCGYDHLRGQQAPHTVGVQGPSDVLAQKRQSGG